MKLKCKDYDCSMEKWISLWKDQKSVVQIMIVLL